jgi:hypothetical protein
MEKKPMDENKICVLWNRSIRSGAIFSISLICKSKYKKLFVFKENIKINDVEVFKHFLFIDNFSDDEFKNEKIINTIKILKERNKTVSYLDSSDSPEIKHLNYIKYFANWFKKQMYVDLQNYEKNLIGGRLYSNYYAAIGSVNSINNESNKNSLNSGIVKLYWNILLGPYPLSATKLRVMRYAVKYFGVFYLRYFNFSIIKKKKNLNQEKKILLSQRIGNYKIYTPEVGYQRRLISNILSAKLNYDLKKVSQKKYNCEMKKTLFTISPFGWGEICHRDAEAFMYGSILIKPNMDHIITKPNLFLKDETYVDFNWDCSNLIEKVNNLIDNKTEFSEVAKQGMNKFYEENENFNKYVMDLYKNIVYSQ